MNATAIINELLVACQRTKYQEAAIFHERKYDKSGNQRRRLSKDASSRSRTWTEILKDLCSVMPLVTDEDHALVSRLLSLCILSYAMPQICRFVEKDSERDSSIPKDGKEKNGMMFQMRLLTLEMVLERSPQIRHLSTGQFDPCSIDDECISSSFFDFIHNGLGPFLCSRPMSNAISAGCDIYANSGSADLLHVLSMAISGDISLSDYSDIAGSDENGNEVKFKFSDRTKNLVAKRLSDFLQVSAVQRGKLVHVVTNSLVLPKINVPQESSSLLMNGILHFRTALKNFASCALSIHQGVDARRGLVWSAIDSECFAHSEMKTLVTSLVSNKTKHFRGQRNCRGTWLQSPRARELGIKRVRYVGGRRDVDSTLQEQIAYQRSLDSDLCVHCANGDILSDLILRYNGARMYADGTFTSQALAELTIAIATLLGQIDNTNELEKIDVSNLPTACTIASVLDAANALFYFLLGDKDKEEMPEAQQLEIGMKDALLECVIQLLGSTDRCVAISSSSLLALAASYENATRVEAMQLKVVARLTIMLEKSSRVDDYRDVVEVLSRRSHSFAKSVSECLMRVFKKSNLSHNTITMNLRLLSLVATAQPLIVSSVIGDVHKAVGAQMGNAEIAKQWTALLLTCFGLQYVDKYIAQKQSIQISDALTKVRCMWSRFQLARHALSNAQFQVACDLFEGYLLASVSSAPSYIWISSLSLIARSEALLSKTGLGYLSRAISDLELTVTKIHSLPRAASFQIEFLLLRKDFLQLCLVVTNLCAEMRLTNFIGSRTSRQALHQKNVSKCFHMLGSRYFSMYKRYGFFTCQHTQSTIRSQFALCRFLGDAARKVFSEKHSKATDETDNFPCGDLCRIQVRMIQKFRSDLLGRIDKMMEPSARSKLLLDIIDVILRCPNPFPKCFTNLKTIPCITVQIAMKSQDTQTFAALSLDQSLSRARLGQPLQIRLWGVLPEALMRNSLSQFSQIIATFTFSLTGPLQRDVDAEDLVVEKTSDAEDFTTSATSDLLPNYNADVRFVIDCKCPAFQRHGYYNLELKLQIRDIRCGEYEVVSNLTDKSIVIACKPTS